MNTDRTNALFTRESLMSLQGAALATLVIPNVLAYMIGPGFLPFEKWIGFGIAMLLALYTAYQSSEAGVQKWAIAVLNGFLIFAAAAGLSDAFGSMKTADVPPGPPNGVPFFHSWFQ
jgi:hypothetical protein